MAAQDGMWIPLTPGLSETLEQLQLAETVASLSCLTASTKPNIA